MRIGIFTDTFTPEINGVATSCSLLFEVLKNNGHEVFVFTTGDKTYYDEKEHIYRIKGVTLKRIYNYKLVFPFSIKILKFIKNLNLDVIHANTEYGVGLIGFNAAKRYKIPLVYTFHTMIEYYTYYITHGFLDNIAKDIVRKLIKKYVYNSDETIVPSEATKKYFKLINLRKYINVVPTGLSLDTFIKNALTHKENKENLKKTLQIPNNFKVFLIIGRISKEKNFDETLAYINSFIKKYNYEKVKVLVVGDGPYLEELKKECDNLNMNQYVSFLGKVPHEEVSKYYAISDVFINSSITETQGLTYLEALASNTIVLARKADFLEGVIIDNESGFIYKNENDFIKHLVTILNLSNSDKERINNNTKKILDKYSISSFYKNILRVYNRAIKDHY